MEFRIVMLFFPHFSSTYFINFFPFRLLPALTLICLVILYCTLTRYSSHMHFTNYVTILVILDIHIIYARSRLYTPISFLSFFSLSCIAMSVDVRLYNTIHVSYSHRFPALTLISVFSYLSDNA